MPLDHFVSQVHLKRFYSPLLRNRMYALRKPDMKSFTPDAESICRTPERSTNAYLDQPRLIEEFLKGVEPRYNDAVARLVAGTIDAAGIYALSGFVAYVVTCSPAGMRLQSTPFRTLVEETGRRLDAAGTIPAPPVELGGSSFTELLERGELHVKVDPKYPQAVGIASILKLANTFGNFGWEVLVNEHGDSPYFTSDFPVALESTPDPRILNRIVPLAPTVAVRFHPNLAARDLPSDFTYPAFTCRLVSPSRPQASRINEVIVRSAEELVLFRDQHPWVERFVHRNASYRIHPTTQRVEHGTGAVLLSRLQVTNSHHGAGT